MTLRILLRVEEREETAFRYEERRYGSVVTRCWITRDNRLLQSEYGGPLVVLTSRAEALKGLPAGVSSKLD